jgi:predicted ATP-binding protein involved in virulence
VIAMVGLIYEFLKSLRQESANQVCKRSGIILIDEVDAHLHPICSKRS